MEGLNVRAYIVTGLLLVTAAWSQFSPRPGRVAGRTETWMEQVAPKEVEGYRFIPSTNPDEGALCSYKDPKIVYDVLTPTVGILARVYEAGGQKFDVTLIASRDRASFHDPRVCFTAQGYNIVNEEQISIPTKSRGNIPATLAQMTGPDGKPTVAVYFYRGPRGFFGTTMSLKIALLLDQVKGRTDLDGVFYRFIPQGLDSKALDPQRLENFIGLYMDKAGKDSNGYF